MTVNKSLLQSLATLLHLRSRISRAVTPPSEMSWLTYAPNQEVNVASVECLYGRDCYTFRCQELGHDSHDYPSPRIVNNQTMANTSFKEKENKNKNHTSRLP